MAYYPKAFTAGTAQPLSCVWAAICVQPFYLSHLAQTWGSVAVALKIPLWEIILSTQQKALGEARKPWPSKVKPSPGCTAEAVNPSETPKAAHMYPASPTPCQLVQACPPSRAKAGPAQQPTPPAGLVFRLVVAWFTWKHLPSRTGDLRGPWTQVHQAHVKASGSSEHSVGFSWCHCTFWKLPSTLASLSFPLADFIAKCAFACVSGGLWGVGCSGRNSCLQGLVLCNYVQLEFSVDRDRFTSYK